MHLSSRTRVAIPEQPVRYEKRDAALERVAVAKGFPEGALDGLHAGPLDVERANQKILQRKKLTDLPFRKQLEDEFQRDLSWVKIRKGEAEAMRLVQEDWLVVGNTLFFGEEQPDYQQVSTAISTALDRRKVNTS